MIKIITGRPGSGKSYFGTRLAYKEMLKGRRIYSNLRISFRKGDKEYTNYNLNKNMIVDFQFPEDSILIIDEAGFWFNSREFKKFKVEDFQFFSQHRHLNIDIYLIVQNIQRIDVSLRELADEIIISKGIFGLFFFQKVFYGIEKYDKDESVPKRLFTLRKKYTDAYSTNQCLENFLDREYELLLNDYNVSRQTYKEFIKGIFIKPYNKSVIDEYSRLVEVESKLNLDILKLKKEIKNSGSL